MLDATDLPVVASGGVGSAADLRALAALRSPGTGRALLGAVVGKALVDGRLGRGGGDGRVRTVRVIPCLDVTGGRVVKGVRFVDLVDAGDPVELAARYDAEGADELTFLDITASSDGRDTMVAVVARTAEQVFIPFTVGGGVRTADDARRLLRAGADKVAVNTAALERPAAGGRAGRRVRGPVRGGGHRRPGPRPTAGAGRSTPTAAAGRPDRRRGLGRAQRRARGRGDPAHLHGPRRDPRRVRPGAHPRGVDAVDVPVVASGGVGTLDHLVEGAMAGGADAVLAASIFHRREHTVAEAKAYLAARGVAVRPPDRPAER